MGAAAGIVGLGLQAAGTLQGSKGVNTNAKYAADMYALQVAEQNAMRQQELVTQQALASDAFAKYQYDQQLLQYQGEYAMAEQSLRSQYEAAKYQADLNSMNMELERTGNKVNNALQQAAYNQEYENTIQANRINQLNNQINLQASQLQRNAQRQGIDAQKGLQQIQNNINQSQINLKRGDLNNQLSQISQAGFGIDAKELGYNNQLRQTQRSLWNQADAGDIQESRGKTQAELGQTQFFNQLLRDFSGNEQQYRQLAARMNALGLGQGVQGASAESALYNNQGIEAARASQRGQYGAQLGDSKLQNWMTQQQVREGLGNMQLDEMMQRDAFGRERQSLGTSLDNLYNQYRGLDVQQQGLGANQTAQELERRSLLRGLDMADQYDVFSQQLLPNLGYEQQNNMARNNLALRGAGNNLQDFLQQQNYNQGMYSNNVERGAASMNQANARQVLDADLARQLQANEANYTSSLGANQTGLASALAQIASNQYGILSGLGGYQNSGGGLNLGALNGLLSQAAQVFGNNMGSRANSAVSSWGNASNYAATQPFVRRPTGNFSDINMSNNIF